ncbi:Mitochondrial formate dehydrogenase [Heracleum sosnowskyi]|uniref:Mitochondrial formate dehydrogenase n=1 Tax=Heracleum sosnowskyi TaxID=360622 RepID=A0AAD8IUQ6_9APIA|nr:Mitochondrial formate dehydrogenase [Heracleum sosnowskyi]
MAAGDTKNGEGSSNIEKKIDMIYYLGSSDNPGNASAESKKIVGVFYEDNEYASANPSFLGCAENALGIREWLESKGHQYIVTDDKEGPDCELEKHIHDLHVLISTPFHPAYVTAERIKKAKNLQLLLTAGIGSDHIDLNAAAAIGLTVAEITGRNLFLLQKMSLKMEPEIENQIGA